MLIVPLVRDHVIYTMSPQINEEFTASDVQSNGLNTTNGANGVNGVNGINGTNGVNGVNGTNGHSELSGNVNGSHDAQEESPAVQPPAPLQEEIPTPAPETPVQAPVEQQPAAQTPATRTVKKSQFLLPTDSTDVHDLLCVGFGPASLSIAIAMHDKLAAGGQIGSEGRAPRVLFLEKQPKFTWHAGMLLPGAKMQISFLKDLASLRDPKSQFTFLNYLSEHDRLIDFINLNTFLPARVEFEDYLRWCASHFDDLVQYNHEVLSVTPDPASSDSTASGVKTFTVSCRNVKTGTVSTYRAKNVVVAIGGQPQIPEVLSVNHPRVIHSSQYAKVVPNLLTDSHKPYSVAVIGAGQSAAEIFTNVQNLYPNSRTHLIMRSDYLRPSDDSPFINGIFNPEFTDVIHSKSAQWRQNFFADAKPTNYSVVRLELIESIFERMYGQKLVLGPDETQWPHRIRSGYIVKSVEPKGPNSEDGLQIRIAPVPESAGSEEVLDVDLVISATGYQRSAHLSLLKDSFSLLPPASAKATVDANGKSLDGWQVSSASSDGVPQTRKLEVGRNYGVKFDNGAVQPGSGVWLQGCCEGTHGLSDTLLSVLAVRSGEMVESIFQA